MEKHPSLFGPIMSYEEKIVMTLVPDEVTVFFRCDGGKGFENGFSIN